MRNAETTPEERKAAEAEHDSETEQWSRIEQLLAGVRDELHFMRHNYESAHSKNKPKWKPKQLVRPGVKPDRKDQKLNSKQADKLWHHLNQQIDST